MSMNHADQISELLLRWEEMQIQGVPVSSAELCRDCPELIPALEEQIRVLRSMNAFVGEEAPGGERQRPEMGSAEAPSSVGRRMSTQSNYEVLRLHAKGGLGEVLVARDELLGRNVALKVIRQPYDRDPFRRKRFVREAEITSRLEHPGIVPVHGIGQDRNGELCYAMRFVTGESLHDAIRKFHESVDVLRDEHIRNLELRRLLTRFVSVCNAIAYAHNEGVLHRDLKPSNIMLGEFGETLVVDWGLAKRFRKDASDAAAPLDSVDASPAAVAAHARSESGDEIQPPNRPFELATRVGERLGTPAFMSPEQSRGDPELGPASDIYSLGATVYMLLTGQPPYDGRNIGEVVDAIGRGSFPPPHQVKADVSRALEAICLKAMAADPAARYASALDLANDVEKWLADEPVSAYPEPWSVRCQRWMRRHRLVVTSVSAGLAVALGCAVILLAVVSRSNEQLRIANVKEGKAKSEAQTQAVIATHNAELAANQSELALRSLQSVTYDIQRKLKNVPAAHKVRRDLLDISRDGLEKVAASLEQRPQVDQGLMVAHRDLGDVFYEVGSDENSRGTEAARVQFQRAFEIARKLADAAPADLEAHRQLAICHDRLGDISDRMGSTPTALEHYEHGLAIREKLLKAHPESEQLQRDISVSLNKLGDLKLKGGAVEIARDHFRRALDIRLSQEARRVQDENLERDLALCYSKMGVVTLRIGETQKALDLFLAGLKINQRRAERNPADDEAQRDVTTSFERLGNASWVMGKFQDSADYYKKSLDINVQRAAADPTNSQNQRDVMQASDKMFDVLTKLGDHVEAQKHLDRMISICEQLVRADPSDLRAMRDLAIAHTAKADRLAATSQIEEAIKWHRKSLETRQQRAAADPSDPRGPSDVAFGLTKLGDGLLAAEKADEALQSYSEALEIHKQRCHANPTDRLAQTNLSAYYQRIGVACRRVSRFDQSAENYREGLKIAQKLSEADVNDMRIRVMILTFYHSLGYLEQSRQRFEDAHRWYGEALALARQLSDAGKLTGEDATWVSYIEDSIQECRQAERDRTVKPMP